MFKSTTAAILSLIFLSLLYFSAAKPSKSIIDESKSHPKYEITVTHQGKTVGTITIETFPEVAPKHCANFDSLVSIGFYDGTAFHRVIPGFMIQGGDPNSKNKPRNTWGYGDPSQRKVPAEFSEIPHERGILSTARSQDINSAASQFFIMVERNSGLDGQYTVFGRVIGEKSMEVADYIVNVPRDEGDNPLEKVEMTIKKLPAEK